MIYLGTLGRMVGVKCPASQQLSHVGEPTFTTTLEGRIVGELPPAKLMPKRAWSLQTSDATTPEQAATLMQFALGAWGKGPFVFVSADAPVTNLLSPEVSLLPSSGGTLTPGGPMLLEGGSWAGQSTLNPSPATQNIQFGNDDSPVLVGEPVTGSAYISGTGAYVLLQFFDAAGALVSAHASPLVNNLAVGVRVSVTAIAPALAVKARISARSTDRAAQPATTWTTEPLPWAVGEGCPKALVHSASRVLVLASRDLRGGRYSNLSFTVTEVG